MNNSSVLVDTNILLYAHDESSFYHEKAKDFLEKNLPEQNLAISTQNIIEYYSLVTNPKRFSVAISSKAVQDRIGKWLETGFYKIISPTVTTTITLLRILGDLPIKGPDIFDAYLAATAIDNGIDTIYTADAKIFKKLGLKVIDPLT